MASKLEYYISLVDYTYSELVAYLIDKYGTGVDDYYSEKSYKKFMAGKIKSITKGKYSRTQEGLYAHHIDENKRSHLSSKDHLKKKKVPFKYHKKERLVYCDLIEHAILHLLIIQESDGKLGNGGMIIIIPLIESWYVHKLELSLKWQISCRDNAFLTKEDALVLLARFEQIPILTADKIKKLGWLYDRNSEDYESDYPTKEEFIKHYAQFPYSSDEITAEQRKSEEKARIKKEKDNLERVKERERLDGETIIVYRKK